jgi:phosphoserine phosphatase RsbU/P
MNQDQLQTLVATLADSYDQLVFLERAIKHSASCDSFEDIVPILHEARKTLAAEEAALCIDGRWQTPVPTFIADLAAYATTMVDPALIVPFEGGWSAFWGRPHAFGAPERKIAEAFGRLVVSLCKNIRLRQKQKQLAIETHEQQLAANLWRSIMLQPQAQLHNHVWQALYEPAKDIGGDFYLLEQGWAVVGDISGKGLIAATLSGMFQAATKVALHQENPLLALETAMFKDFVRSGMFCTLFAAKFEAGGELAYINLGHPAALLLHPSGTVRRLPATGLPFGVLSNAHLELQRVQMKKHEILLIYTDGITESVQGDLMFSEQRLIGLLQGVQSVAEIFVRLHQAMRHWQIEDDVCLLAIQFEGAKS